MITMAKTMERSLWGQLKVSDKIYNAIVDNGPEHGVEFFTDILTQVIQL